MPVIDYSGSVSSYTVFEVTFCHSSFCCRAFLLYYLCHRRLCPCLDLLIRLSLTRIAHTVVDIVTKIFGTEKKLLGILVDNRCMNFVTSE